MSARVLVIEDAEAIGAAVSSALRESGYEVQHRLDGRQLEADLGRAGYEVRPTAVSPVGLVLEKCGPVTELPQFRAGAFYIEDEAGQLVPLILDPQPGERVLDACAAPGGKATHLAALMRNRGEIVAIDR